MMVKLFLKVLVNGRSRNACQNVVAVLCQRILNNLNYPCPHANHCDFQTWCKKADSQKVIEAKAALPPFHIWCVLTFQMKSRSRASRSLFVAAKKCTIATGAEVSTAQHQINEQLILFKLSQFPKVLSLGAASIVEILITKAITLTVMFLTLYLIGSKIMSLSSSLITSLAIEGRKAVA